jgi:hypothetical protein
VAKATVVASFGCMIRCGWFALASAVWLVGQHIGE